MFTLDPHLGNAELKSLADNFSKLTPETQNNIAQVMNKDHSDEFYQGLAAAFYAAAMLLTDKNYPEEAKPVVLQGALGFVAAKLVSGHWPL